MSDGTMKRELPANAEQVQGDEAKIVQRMYVGKPTWGFDCADGFAPFGEGDGNRKQAERAFKQYQSGAKFWSLVPIADCPLVESAEPSGVQAGADEAMGEDERWVRARKQYATPFECTSKGVIVGYVIADAMTGKQLGDISTFSYGPVARRLAWRNAADRLGKSQAETASTEQKVLCRALSADKMVECEKLAGHQPANEHEGHFADKSWCWTTAPAAPESSADATQPVDTELSGFDQWFRESRPFGVSRSAKIAMRQAWEAALAHPTPRETAPADLLPCGHQKSEMLTSVETGETLYCALCDKVAAACDRKIEEFVAEKDAEIAKLKLRLSSAPADATLDCLRDKAEQIAQQLFKADDNRWNRAIRAFRDALLAQGPAGAGEGK